MMDDRGRTPSDGNRQGELKKKIANKKQEMFMIPMFFLPNQDEIRIFFVEDITNIICII
jgi:hypothetical protein